MANRWMRPDGTPPDKAGEESTARGGGVLPPGAVESGRTAGRRAVFAFLGWLSLRRLGDSWRHVTEQANHSVLTGAVVAAGATAAVIVGATATPALRPSVEPRVIATAQAPSMAPSAPSSIVAVRRSLANTAKATFRTVAPVVTVDVPSVPRLPVPSPLPSPPPLRSPPPLPIPIP